MQKLNKIYFWLGLVVLVPLILSACGPTRTDNVLAPIQYDTVKMPDMNYAESIPGGDTDKKLYPSLKLGEDQVSVCKLPGGYSEPFYVIVTTEGPNPYPAKYCTTPISTRQQTYVTMHDVATECTGGKEFALCRDEISRLPLLDNATATGNVKIGFYHVVNDTTKQMFYELGYENVMYDFNRAIKDGIRKKISDSKIALDTFDKYQIGSDIESYVKNKEIFDDASESPYKAALKEAFRIVSFEFTYLEPDGLNNEAAAQISQEAKAAGAVATQWAIACSAYPEGSNQRLVCECNYTCAKSGQSCSCSAGINPVPSTPINTPTPTP